MAFSWRSRLEFSNEAFAAASNASTVSPSAGKLRDQVHTVICGCLFQREQTGFAHGGAQVSHPRLGNFRRKARKKITDSTPRPAAKACRLPPPSSGTSATWRSRRFASTRPTIWLIEPKRQIADNKDCGQIGCLQRSSSLPSRNANASEFNKVVGKEIRLSPLAGREARRHVFQCCQVWMRTPRSSCAGFERNPPADGPRRSPMAAGAVLVSTTLGEVTCSRRLLLSGRLPRPVDGPPMQVQ